MTLLHNLYSLKKHCSEFLMRWAQFAFGDSVFPPEGKSGGCEPDQSVLPVFSPPHDHHGSLYRTSELRFQLNREVCTTLTPRTERCSLKLPDETKTRSSDQHQTPRHKNTVFAVNENTNDQHGFPAEWVI